MKRLLSIFCILCLPVYGHPLYPDLTFDEELEFNKLSCSIFTDDESQDVADVYHIIQEVKNSGGTIVLTDGSEWTIGWWDQFKSGHWEPNERVQIFLKSTSSGMSFTIKNCDRQQCFETEIQKLPSLHQADVITEITHLRSSSQTVVYLSNGAVLIGPETNWCKGQGIFVFHTSNTEYILCNLQTGYLVPNWTLKKIEKKKEKTELLMGLEDALNKRVLGQEHAIKALSTAIITYAAGLCDNQLPIGVFLFIGPTGVGKTELAKSLAIEYYESSDQLIRFDMAQFNTRWTVSRLIGSPPGYVNSDEGGQLSEALKKNPESIVLLDEVEKADPEVLKFFLSIFDEGTFSDACGDKISCKDAIFILTSNLGSLDIFALYEQGYSPEEIVKILQPAFMQHLSPELYNRITPIIFRPIDASLMPAIIEQQLSHIKERFKKTRNITITVGEGVKKYLTKYGYEPELGVRPLRRLIKKEIVDRLAYIIVKEQVPDSSEMYIEFDSAQEEWTITWL